MQGFCDVTHFCLYPGFLLFPYSYVFFKNKFSTICKWQSKKVFTLPVRFYLTIKYLVVIFSLHNYKLQPLPRQGPRSVSEELFGSWLLILIRYLSNSTNFHKYWDGNAVYISSVRQLQLLLIICVTFPLKWGSFAKVSIEVRLVLQQTGGHEYWILNIDYWVLIFK